MTIKLEYKPIKLDLKYPFGISREVKHSVTNVFVKLTYETNGEKYFGFGEAAPSKFYGETTDSVLAYLKWVNDTDLLNIDPYDITGITNRLEKIRYNNSAKSAINCALYDIYGKKHNIPSYKYLNFSSKIPETSYTIDISNLEMILKKTGDALITGYDIFKVKLGTDMDEEIIFSIRQAAPDVRIRVDANGAWDLKTALSMLKVLKHHNIELIEQPLAQDNIKDLKILRESSSIPIIVDESCVNYKDIPDLYGKVDGVNIKLSKCGGITNAIKTLYAAKSCNMKVMVGCFLETSLGISAAGIIASQADYVDLDGFLLIKEDPFNLIETKTSQLILSEEPGISIKTLY